MFEEIVLPERESLPFSLAIDNDGKIWFTTTGAGKIGYIDPKDNQITQFLTHIQNKRKITYYI